jgi:hypothetical protein
MADLNLEDAVQLLRTVAQHRDLVRVGLDDIARDLQRRSLVHDLSKLSADEFGGFSRINRAAREHPYGSDEYRAGLRQEKPTIELHYSRNSHHPEFHELPHWSEPHYFKAELMGFLDIIEMVCDWRGAYIGYGSQGTWEENIERQHERYKEWFSAGQWWLIDQVAAWLVADSRSMNQKRPDPPDVAAGVDEVKP